MQFHKIKDTVIDEDKGKINRTYVDNGNFYPGRVDEAVYATVYFIQNFSGGFEYATVQPEIFTLGLFDKYLKSIGIE